MTKTKQYERNAFESLYTESDTVTKIKFHFVNHFKYRLGVSLLKLYVS